MTDEKKAERVVALVGEMRNNSSDMQMWKNIALAQECLALLRSIDPSSESASGQALVCTGIAEQLPQYDMPCLTLEVLRYGYSQLLRASEEELKPYPYLKEDLETSIARLEDYIDTAHVSDEAFREKYGRLLKSDPIERTPMWESIYVEVEEECDRRLGDISRGMGFCHAHWSTMSQVLAERGIKWRSPSRMNPGVMFD